jgi:hypothetical protein
MMWTRTAPEDGDIVVSQEKRDGMVVFILHIAPGPDRHLFHLRDEAAAHALTLAERHGVRAWLTTDESYDFLLLESVIMTSVEDVLHRVRTEYLEMPGLRLKAEQAPHLCGVEQTICQVVLDVLVDEQFLSVNSDGDYARPTDGHDPRTKKADLRIDMRSKKAS